MQKLPTLLGIILMGGFCLSANAEPIIVADKHIVDSSGIAIKIHGLPNEGYLIDVFADVININYGCAGEVSDEQGVKVLEQIQEYMDDEKAINIIEALADIDYECNERRREGR